MGNVLQGALSLGGLSSIQTKALVIFKELLEEEKDEMKTVFKEVVKDMAKIGASCPS